MWEYTSVRVPIENFDDTLNGYGKVGWEVVSVIQEPKFGPFDMRRKAGENQQNVVAFMKRPV